MSEKPGDFFLGVIDFFGILVPGIALLALQGSTLAHLAAIPLPSRENWWDWVPALVAAYVIGHFLLGLGVPLNSLVAAVYPEANDSLLSRSTESSSGPTRSHLHPLYSLQRRLLFHPDYERQCPRGGRAPSGRIQALSKPYPALLDRRHTVSSNRLLVRSSAGG